MTRLVGPLSDEFFLALGRLTANFSMLESQISGMIWALIGRDQVVGQIVTAELSFQAQVSLLSALFKYRCKDNGLVQLLEALLTTAQQVGAKRNRFVHSYWGVGDSPDDRTRIKSTAKKGKGLQHQFERVKATDIEAVAAEASELAAQIQRLVFDLPDEIIPKVRITV